MSQFYAFFINIYKPSWGNQCHVFFCQLVVRSKLLVSVLTTRWQKKTWHAIYNLDSEIDPNVLLEDTSMIISPKNAENIVYFTIHLACVLCLTEAREIHLGLTKNFWTLEWQWKWKQENYLFWFLRFACSMLGLGSHCVTAIKYANVSYKNKIQYIPRRVNVGLDIFKSALINNRLISV